MVAFSELKTGETYGHDGARANKYWAKNPEENLRKNPQHYGFKELVQGAR